MIVIPPVAIAPTTTTVPEVAAAAYNAGTTYALGNEVSVAGAAGLQTQYRSLQNSNTGHTPASSPTWWVNIGDVYQAYNSGTTYALGDRVQDNANHLIYEALTAGESGNALTNTAKWLEIGPTNAYAMFDTLRSTATTAPSSISVTITPGQRVDAIAVLGLVANSITITEDSGVTEVFSETIDLNTREVFDWYGYFFNQFTTQGAVARFAIPPYSNGVITVTATATSGNVSIGAVVVGLQEYIGAVQYSAESDVLNFSTVDRDFDGNVNTMVQRRNVPKTVQSIYLDKARVNRVRAVREELNAVPAVWSGLDDDAHEYFESLLILGFYKRFSINLRQPTVAVISLELEEI